MWEETLIWALWKSIFIMIILLFDLLSYNCHTISWAYLECIWLILTYTRTWEALIIMKSENIHHCPKFPDTLEQFLPLASSHHLTPYLGIHWYVYCHYRSTEFSKSLHKWIWYIFFQPDFSLNIIILRLVPVVLLWMTHLFMSSIPYFVYSFTCW